LNLLSDCIVDPAFDRDAEHSRLRDITERKPNCSASRCRRTRL